MTTTTELEPQEQLRYVGKRVPRVDVIPKLTGEAKYYDDIQLPGLLICKILRSPYPHARIKRIDISKAEALPGVKAVITGKDVPVKFSFNYVEHLDAKKKVTAASDVAALRGLMPAPRADKAALAIDKVRFIGDEIAAVAAVDEETAIDALSLIEVEFERLPAVFDPQEAMKQSAPQLHDDAPGNVAAHLFGEWGNVEEGFKQADLIVENTFKTTHQSHACMETHGCVMAWDGQGNLTVWNSTQTPYTFRRELARALKVSYNRVKVISEFVGGAFGSKNEMMAYHVICAYLAKKAGAPVKIRLTREEEFMSTGCRHPYTLTLKTGVKKDGSITARQVNIIVDKGAYITQGPAIAFYCLTVPMPGIYRPANYKYECKLFYTNKQPPSAFRGFGNPQAAWALESQMDIIAEKLGMDPKALRLRNANKPGDITLSGFEVSSCGMSECIERASKTIGWDEKRKNKFPNRGVGMACLFHSSGERGAYGDCDTATATVKVNDDGSVTLFLGSQEIGTGNSTAQAQIVAETLGVRFEDIRVVMGDTDLPAFDLGAYASRTTLVSGNAVKVAAAKTRELVLQVAANSLGVSPNDLDAKESRVFIKSKPEKSMTFEEVGTAAYYGSWKDHQLVGVGTWDAPSTLFDHETKKWKPPGMAATYTFACQAVEVEVDPETGAVKVLNVASAHDLGRAINPTLAEGQIEGAIQQGLGYALSEDMRIEEGKTLVTDFRDYFLRRAPDMPKIEAILVETKDAYGAYGLKGIGEPAMVPVAPAIANAIYDAVGVRIYDLPITREKVLKALEALKH